MFDDAIRYNREKLVGLKNIYGTVVGYRDPEYISSDSYDTELIFDTGVVCRWKALGANSRGKMSYYQSDEYNLRESK